MDFALYITMQEFKLDFIFDHVHRMASVSVIKRPDHIQYTIVPDDPVLARRFATQVIHRFGERFDFAFPTMGKTAAGTTRPSKKPLNKVQNSTYETYPGVTALPASFLHHPYAHRPRIHGEFTTAIRIDGHGIGPHSQQVDKRLARMPAAHFHLLPRLIAVG